MSQRPSILTVRTLTKSEYIQSKNIPNSNILKKQLPNAPSYNDIVPPTSLPITKEKRIVHLELDRSLQEAQQREMAALRKRIQELENENLYLRESQSKIIYDMEQQFNLTRMELERQLGGRDDIKYKLEQEIGHLRQFISNLEKELQGKQSILIQQEQIIVEMKNENSKMNQDNAIKLILFGMENERLYLVLDDLIKENMSLKEFAQNIEQSYRLQMQETEVNFQKQIRDTLERERINLISRFDKEKLLLESRINEQNKLLQDLQNQYNNSQFNLQQITEEYKYSNQQIKTQLAEDLMKAQIKNILLSVEVERLQRLKGEQEQLNDEKFQSYQNKIKELEIKLNILSQESSRLHISIEDRDREIGDSRSRYQDLESSYKRLLEENSTLKQQINDKSNQGYEQDIQMNSLRQKLNEYQVQIQILNDSNSRIQQLADDRLKQLEQKVQIINQLEHKVMLITQEIERVSTLVYQKEKECDDNQRDMYTEIQNMETQMKMYKQQCLDYDIALVLLGVEIERLQSINNEYQQQIEYTQVKYKNDINQNRNLMEQSIHELTIKITNEKGQYEDTIINLKNKIDNNLKLINQLENQLEQKSMLLHEKDNQFNNQKDMYRDLDAKAKRDYDAMKFEKDTKITELMQQLNYQSNNNQQYQNKIDELENIIGQISVENERLVNLLNDKTSRYNVLQGEYNNMNVQLSQEINVLRDTIHDKDLYIKEQEDKVMMLQRDISKLNQIINEKDNEIYQWKMKINNLEKHRTEELEELSIQFETYRKNLLENELQIKFDAERASYETQIMQLTSKLKEFENRIMMLVSENQRLSSVRDEKENELEKLRITLNAFENGNLGEMEKLRSQVDLLKRLNLDSRELIMKLNGEKQTLETQIFQIQQTNSNSTNELKRAYELLNERKIENEEQTASMDELRKEGFILKNRIKNLETEIPILQKKISQLIQEKEELEQDRNSYRIQTERVNQELTRKNEELKAKIYEVDALKQKYEEAMNDYAGQTSKLITRMTLKTSKIESSETSNSTKY